MILDVPHPAILLPGRGRGRTGHPALARLVTRCEIREVGAGEAERLPDLRGNWNDVPGIPMRPSVDLLIPMARHGGATYVAVDHLCPNVGRRPVSGLQVRRYLADGNGGHATEACDLAFAGSPVRDFAGELAMQGHPADGRGQERAREPDDAEAAASAVRIHLRDDFLLIDGGLYRRYRPLLNGMRFGDGSGAVAMTLSRTVLPGSGFSFGWERIDEARASVGLPDAPQTREAMAAPPPDAPTGQADVIRTLSVGAALMARYLHRTEKRRAERRNPLDEVRAASAGLHPVHLMARTGRLEADEMHLAVSRIAEAIAPAMRELGGSGWPAVRIRALQGYLSNHARPRLTEAAGIPEEDAAALRVL